jgi:Zn ribbon nucleic-acid-binding protein
MKKIFLIAFILVSASSMLYPQDSLLLLNGKMLNGKITAINDTGVVIKGYGLFNKHKYVYKDELFSVKNGLTETIVYIPDSFGKESFSVEQMRWFIKGQQEARKNYHAPLATAGGFLAGSTGALLGFWGMTTVPASYVFLAGIKTPECKLIEETYEIAPRLASQSGGYSFEKSKMKVRYCDNIPDEKLKECYEYGYESAAKDKKIKNAVKGTVAGIVAVFAGTIILFGL